MTDEVFRRDAYAQSCEARITAVDGAGVRLDRTVFYPTGGGQPGGRRGAGPRRRGRHPDRRYPQGRGAGRDRARSGDPGRPLISPDRRSPPASTGIGGTGSCGCTPACTCCARSFPRRSPAARFGTAAAGSISICARARSTRKTSPRGSIGSSPGTTPSLHAGSAKKSSMRTPPWCGRCRLRPRVDRERCGYSGSRVSISSPAAAPTWLRPARSGGVRVTKIEKKGRQNRRVSVAFDG